MPQTLRDRFVLLSLSMLIYALPTLNVEAATSAIGCKHLSPDKMALCQQKSKVKLNKLHEKPKPGGRHGIDAKDLLWLIL